MYKPQDYLIYLEEFLDIYDNKIFTNLGGMRFNHAFALFSYLRLKQPENIIECGVYKGFSTWVIENAIPNANIHCVDIKLKNLEYRSKNATYYETDFFGVDWSDINKKNTVCFFDDHQSHLKRILQTYWWGFKEIIFEDNFLDNEGDFYSLNQIFSTNGHSEFQLSKEFNKRSIKNKIYNKLELFFLEKNYWNQHLIQHPNQIDSKIIHNNIKKYFFIPPVYFVGDRELKVEQIYHYLTPETKYKFDNFLNSIDKKNYNSEFGYNHFSVVELN